MIIAAVQRAFASEKQGAFSRLSGVKLAIDLNAVPPAGLSEIGVTDKAVERSGIICSTAHLGVGGLKMKVHKKAITLLFTANDLKLDTRSIYELALKVAGING